MLDPKVSGNYTYLWVTLNGLGDVTFLNSTVIPVVTAASLVANPYPLALPPGDSSRRLEVEDPRPRPPAARPVGLLRVCSVARHRRIVCRASPPRQRSRDTFDAPTFLVRTSEPRVWRRAGTGPIRDTDDRRGVSFFSNGIVKH